MAMFRYSEVRKGVLVPRGAETHEVVASDPRIERNWSDFSAFWPFFRPFGVKYPLWGTLDIPLGSIQSV